MAGIGIDPEAQFAEAERLRDWARDFKDQVASANYFNEAAQVHATLAVASYLADIAMSLKRLNRHNHQREARG